MSCENVDNAVRYHYLTRAWRHLYPQDFVLICETRYVSLDYIINSLNEVFTVQLDIFISSTYQISSNINELLVCLQRSRIKYYKVYYSFVFA